MNSRKGFTLIELMIVVAIIAIIASIAIPNLLSARVNANESGAIATLRNIVSAQSQFQSQGAVDVDEDGIGEHGFFAEMAGSDVLRAGATLGGTAPALNPPVLSGALGNVEADSAGDSIVRKSGYFFKMYLPGIAGAPIPEPSPIAVGGENANLNESSWICYAWPQDRGTSGNRVFVVNNTGDVLQMANNGPTQYSSEGTDGNVPPGGAACVNAADMTSALSISNRPAPASDANLWVPVQ